MSNVSDWTLKNEIVLKFTGSCTYIKKDPQTGNVTSTVYIADGTTYVDGCDYNCDCEELSTNKVVCTQV